MEEVEKKCAEEKRNMKWNGEIRIDDLKTDICTRIPLRKRYQKAVCRIEGGMRFSYCFFKIELSLILHFYT